MPGYQEIYERSLKDPEGFWGDAARAVDWVKPWNTVLSYDADGTAQWFAGGEANTCWNALDRHVKAGRGDQPALVYDSPVTNTVRKFTYSEFTDLTARVAGMLTKFGVGKGDRVLIYMPVIPEAIAAMLACARIGAVHSVVFGGFAAREVASRIKDAQPKIILAASCGIEPTRVVPYKPAVDAAIEMADDSVKHCIVFQRPQMPAVLKPGRDHDWNDAMADAKPADCVPVAATDPLYIIYTSGTTGAPKGIVRPSGGHLVAMAWTMRHFYDSKPGETFWAASDIGWVVGHSYITYGPLINGNTTVLYEGKPVGTPDPGAFWRVIRDHKVSTMFTAPTAIRAIKREDPEGKYLKQYDISSLRALFLAGERCDPPTSQWAEDMLKLPIVDHWWQTETGWPISGNPLGLETFPIKHGAVTKPLPGWDVQILDNDGKQIARGETGAIVCKLPLPPGMATTLWNAQERYRQAYLTRYPGYYLSGDAGFFDMDGYLNVMTRTDDVINVAGHRLSTGAIEEVLAGHPDIAECAVVGLDDALKGQVPLGLLVLKSGINRAHPAVIDEVVAHVRAAMGAVVAFKTAVVVTRLPKTRSGKILRGTVAKIANGQDYVPPATIEDPVALAEVAASLRTAKIGRVKDGAGEGA
ncbi:MAG: propionyl-CoA synthetase [Rhodospirillaceae bacterium]|nr:propionyl-CoA synthetase [Rhodospirillaceae bacterium]